MPDGTLTADSTDDSASTADTSEQPVSSSAQSVEEVEAFWRNRMSGKDRADAAEKKVLREQIAALEAQVKSKPGEQTGDDVRDAEIARLKQELEQTKITSMVENRRAKYGLAAETLDDETLARMDEARLAALNARLGNEAAGRSSFTDPNAAQRRNQTPTSATAKSADDLKSDLRKYAPGFVNDLFGGS